MFFVGASIARPWATARVVPTIWLIQVLVVFVLATVGRADSARR